MAGGGQSAGKTWMINLQNIPPAIGYYLAGFADGEGSFNITFRPRNDYKLPWKVSACFNISQKDNEMNDGGKRRYSDEEILRAFKNPQRLYAKSASGGMI